MTEILTSLQEIQKQADTLSNRVKTEGITDESGRVLITPTVNDVKDTIGFPDGFSSTPASSALSSLTNTKANADSLTLSLQQQLLENQKKQEEINKALGLKPGEDPMSKIVSMQQGVGTADVQGKTTSAQQQYGVPGLSQEVQQQSLKVASLSGDIDKLDAQRLVEIDRAYAQQGVGMNYIKGQVGEIDRKYNIEKAYKSAELGAQSAMLQAQTGNLQLANNMVTDIVNAYTFDIQQQRKDVSDLINVYGDWFTSLEKDEQNILTDLSNRLEKEETDTKTDLTDKLNLMTDAANNGVNLGLSVNDLASMTLDEVAQMYQTKVSAKKAEVITTSSSVGLLSDTIKASIDAGKTPSEAVFDAITKASGFGLTMEDQDLITLKQSAQQMYDAKNQITTGVDETIKTEETTTNLGSLGSGLGGTMFKPVVTESEKEKIIKENEKRKKLGFPPLPVPSTGSDVIYNYLFSPLTVSSKNGKIE